MTAWWYWLGFAVAVLLLLAVPLTYRYERWQDERDRQAWERVKRGAR